MSAAHPGRRAHRHDRGRGRAAAQPAPRPAARGAAPEHRGRGRDRDPRPRAQLAAHAAGPDHRRRGPRRRGARHAAGDEHGPRRLALHRAREHGARRAGAHRDDGADGRLRPADARDPPAGRVGARPDRPPRAHARRVAQGRRRSREVQRMEGDVITHAGALPLQGRCGHRRARGRRVAALRPDCGRRSPRSSSARASSSRFRRRWPTEPAGSMPCGERNGDADRSIARRYSRSSPSACSPSAARAAGELTIRRGPWRRSSRIARSC